MSGEAEDTDVGFPGPEHHIAEREWAMKLAMGALALLAVVGGVLGIPGVTDTLEHFLEPTFEDSRFHDTVPTEGAEVAGLGVGALLSIAGIAAAFGIFVRRREVAGRLRARFPAVHGFLVNKWYFDELYDAVFVRPAATAGRLSRSVVETDFVQGVITGGATGIVRAGTSFARSIQTGLLRAYAFLLVIGVAGLLLYFLIQSS